MKTATMTWAFLAEKKYGILPSAYAYRSLHPAVGEIVGYRLMRALGIGTAPSVEIVESEEARRRDPRKWIFKTINADDRLKVCPVEEIGKMGRWILLVQKIPKACPLSFLRKQYGVDAGKVEFASVEDLTSSTMCKSTIIFAKPPGNGPALVPFLINFETIRRAIWADDKPEVPNSADFYSDFVPPENWSAVRRAMTWDSDQMLAIHSARLFLGMSVAHLSNVLVDPEGRLYSIDHEFCSATDAEELRILFDNVKPGTRAFEALRGVAQLSEEKLRELFEGLPAPDWTRWLRWPLGSKEKTVAYHLERLRLWKALFENASKK
jgi:hypothetical protein